MFCPKCGDELLAQNKTLVCQRGQMELSEYLARRLNECFVLKVDVPREFKFSFLVGGKWFCPGCGVLTTEENGFIKCPECKLSLNEFIHSLVERHPHRRENEKLGFE